MVMVDTVCRRVHALYTQKIFARFKCIKCASKTYLFLLALSGPRYLVRDAIRFPAEFQWPEIYRSLLYKIGALYGRLPRVMSLFLRIIKSLAGMFLLAFSFFFASWTSMIRARAFILNTRVYKYCNAGAVCYMAIAIYYGVRRMKKIAK